MKGREDKEEEGVLAWSPLLFPSHCPSQMGLNSGLLIGPLLPSPRFPTCEGGVEDSGGHALGLSGAPALYPQQEERQMAAR